jgi:hypothetical protein
MGSKTNYLEDKVLNHTLRNVEFVRPATVYMGLLTSDPTETGGAGAEVSTSGTGYIRKAITFGAPGDGPGESRQVSNSAAVTYDVALLNWGTLTHFGIYDAEATGNMLYHGALTVAKAVNANDTAEFAIGDIVVTED